MARTTAGASLTVSHARLQRALSARILAQLLRLWPAVDTQRPATFDLFNEAAALLVLDGHRTSGGLAAAYYAGFRMAEGLGGSTTPPLAPPSPADRLRELLRGSAVVGILRARAAGLSVVAERQQGWVQLAGQATSLVLGGGRETTLLAVADDPAVKGFQRVTSGDACAFCAMLASRGPVYTEDGGDFQTHDHCSCSIEPVYAGSRMSATAERYRSTWEAATSGLSGSDAFNAFRSALAGPGDLEAAA